MFTFLSRSVSPLIKQFNLGQFQIIHRILESTLSQSMGTRELKLLLQHIKRPKSELVDLQSDTNIVSLSKFLIVFLNLVHYLFVDLLAEMSRGRTMS